MLSFLQQRLSRSPRKTLQNENRQETIESAFARMNAHISPKDASITPSLTTATTLTDVSSEATDISTKPILCIRRSARPRSSVASYHENSLSAQIAPVARKQDGARGDCSVSGDSPLEVAENQSQQLPLQDSLQVPDGDWDLGAMLGDTLRGSMEGHGDRRRKSTRLRISDQASTFIEKTTSVLGKRGREAIVAGMDNIHALRTDSKRPEFRHIEHGTSSLGNLPTKRARFAETVLEEEASLKSGFKKRTPNRPTKQWLNQGLYLGQYPEFDARLNETRNKLKKASKKFPPSSHRSIMPLPMFRGERILSVGRDFKLPFDVFSPLPPGQPKPYEWKKTHKNIFIGEAADVWKKPKHLEYSACNCTPESGCDEDCFNRIMHYECDNSNCNIGQERCRNRSFANLKQRCKVGGRYNIGVEVMKTIDRGYGVRANRTFDPNQIIVEYTGEIITQDECDERMNKRYKDAECYYLMDFDQSMVLDATRGSIARFVNHSCTPNCRMIKWIVAGKPRMALFAGDEGIMTGQELTYDYNFDPFSAKNVQECKCGTEGCRGVLGPKPKEIREALKPITTGGKRKIQQVIEDAVETVTKKRKITVPSSVKSALASAKAQTSKHLSQSRILGSSTAQNDSLMRKISERSLRDLRRKSVTKYPADRKRRMHTAIRHSRHHSPMGTLIAELVSDGRTLADANGEGVDDRLSNRKEGNKSKAVNVARTLRRSERGTPGKTIRVIGDDEFKGWR